MKKFLSLVLALILVFSMSTVAFAAIVQTYTCQYCGVVTADFAEYNAHVSGGCNVKYRPCQYCGVGTPDEDGALAAHESICPEGSASCDYCGDTFSPVKAYDDHLDACKKSHLNIPVAKITASIKGIDWNNIVTKVIDTLSDLVAKIKPLFESIGA